MSNRWNRALMNQLNEKQEELEQESHREEITHETVLKLEEIERIREELEETPLMNSEEEFEKFERRIEAIEVEEDD